MGVVEQLVEEVAPSLVEVELALQLVEHGESGGKTGLDGELVQEAEGEGVQRADRCAVEPIERGLSEFAGRAGQQLLAHAVAQLPGRLLGERDRRDRLDRNA